MSIKLIPMENCSVISIPYYISDQEHGTIASSLINNEQFSQQLAVELSNGVWKVSSMVDSDTTLCDKIESSGCKATDQYDRYNIFNKQKR